MYTVRHHTGSPTVVIEEPEDLVKLAVRVDLGNDTLTGDQALRRRLAVYEGILGRLIENAALSERNRNFVRLDLAGLYGYEVLP